MTQAWAVFREKGDAFTFTIHRTRSGAIVSAVSVFCRGSYEEAKERAASGNIHIADMWSRIKLTKTQQKDWTELQAEQGFFVARVEIQQCE